MVTSTHAPAAPTAATAVAQASSAKGARIDVRNVSHWFDLPGGALQVIDELDLAIEPGEFVALLGPSGCGKSTLLRLVAGLEPATAGELLQDGAPITQPDPSRIVVFQDPTLFPWRTVWDNVALGLQARGLLKTHRHRVDQALQLVGLEAFAPTQAHDCLSHKTSPAGPRFHTFPLPRCRPTWARRPDKPVCSAGSGGAGGAPRR